MSKSIHRVISQSESVDLVTCHGFCFEFPTKFFRHKDGVVNGNGVTFLSIKRELKHATFLSHGRQPEVNILRAKTLGSPRFSK